MKVTKICTIIKENETELKQLDILMKIFCSAIRYSFNRILEGEKAGELIKKVNVLFNLNKRYAEDAVMQAQAIISSQKELLPIRIEGVKGKIQKTTQKIEDYQTGKKKPKKVPLQLCLEGLHARLVKRQEKETVLLKHQEDQTIPTIIFGGKKQFYQRLKQKISKEEWRDFRSNTLYSRGDKTKKGNLNTRIVFGEQEQQFYLEVANPVLSTGKNSARLRFKYSKMYGLSVHEAASLVIGRRGLDLEEKLPKKLLNQLRSLVKPHLIRILGSMEESEKQSNNGKQRRKYVGMMLENIETFKESHSWKLWNVIHKTLIIKNQELQLKEV